MQGDVSGHCAVVQVTGNGSLDLAGSSGGGEKELDARSILEEG